MVVTSPTDDVLARATALADDVLLARAADVDRGRRDVRDNLDRLADAGLYGLHAPTGAGGMAADADTAGRVVEALAGGCMTTTFAWIQHQGVVKRLGRAEADVAREALPRLASGEVRAGVAVGGVRPGRAPLVAAPDADGWLLTGRVPWITGWGLVDVLLVAAREGEQGDVLWFLLDAPPVDDPGDTLTSPVPTVDLHRVATAACDRANSAVVDLDGHPAPAPGLVARQPYDEWRAADEQGLRTNGSLPLGLAARAARLAEDPGLLAEVDRVRGLLDAADVDGLPAARAAAADLAWHAAQVLVVTTGGRGIGTGAHAQRLAREATFLQVFGSRPSIREAHLSRLAHRRP